MPCAWEGEQSPMRGTRVLPHRKWTPKNKVQNMLSTLPLRNIKELGKKNRILTLLGVLTCSGVTARHADPLLSFPALTSLLKNRSPHVQPMQERPPSQPTAAPNLPDDSSSRCTPTSSLRAPPYPSSAQTRAAPAPSQVPADPCGLERMPAGIRV